MVGTRLNPKTKHNLDSKIILDIRNKEEDSKHIAKHKAISIITLKGVRKW